MKWFQAHKYLVLLTIIIFALLSQSHVHGLEIAFAYIVLLVVFVSVFQHRWDRIVGLLLGIPTMAAEAIFRILPEADRFPAMVAYHALMTVFLAFAVVTILRDIFENRQIGFDHLLGAFSGFLLAGIAWGNLYLLIEVATPGAFTIDPGLTAQLHHEQSRRFIFNYFSFMTLTTLGYGDITPVDSSACNLTWLEAMFGQFYVAVYIGQLMSLKITSRTDA
jgi:hypothetical protein